MSTNLCIYNATLLPNTHVYFTYINKYINYTILYVRVNIIKIIHTC